MLKPKSRESGRSVASIAPWVLAWCMVCFRFIALPLVVAVVLLGINKSRKSIAFCLALLVASASPVDVNVYSVLAAYHRKGAGVSGPRLVPYVSGVRSNSEIKSIYDEYYSGGCYSYTIFPARWFVVLR